MWGRKRLDSLERKYDAKLDELGALISAHEARVSLKHEALTGYQETNLEYQKTENQRLNLELSYLKRSIEDLCDKLNDCGKRISIVEESKALIESIKSMLQLETKVDAKLVAISESFARLEAASNDKFDKHVERSAATQAAIDKEMDLLYDDLFEKIIDLEKSQCITYEKALDRVKAMLTFESQTKLKTEHPTVVNLR